MLLVITANLQNVRKKNSFHEEKKTLTQLLTVALLSQYNPYIQEEINLVKQTINLILAIKVMSEWQVCLHFFI